MRMCWLIAAIVAMLSVASAADDSARTADSGMGVVKPWEKPELREDVNPDSLIWTSAIREGGGPSYLPVPLDIWTEPVSWPSNSRDKAQVAVTVAANEECQSVSLEISEVLGFEYTGKRNWTWQWQKGFKWTDTLELSFSAHDTVSLLFQATTDGQKAGEWAGFYRKNEFHFYFHASDPRNLKPPKPTKVIPDPEANYRVPKVTYSWKDSSGHVIVSDTQPTTPVSAPALESEMIRAARAKGWDWQPGDTTIVFRPRERSPICTKWILFLVSH